LSSAKFDIKKSPEFRHFWGLPGRRKQGFKQVENMCENKQTNKRHVYPPVAQVPFLFCFPAPMKKIKTTPRIHASHFRHLTESFKASAKFDIKKARNSGTYVYLKIFKIARMRWIFL
jgi:hypothetical protein